MARCRLLVTFLAVSFSCGIQSAHAQGGAVLNWFFRSTVRGVASEAESVAAGAGGRAAARAGGEAAAYGLNRGAAAAATRDSEFIAEYMRSYEVNALRTTSFTEMGAISAMPVYEFFRHTATPIGRRVNVIYSLFEDAKPAIAAELRQGALTETKVATAFEKNAIAAADAVKKPGVKFELSSGKIKFDKSFDKFGARFEVGEIDLKSIAGYGAAAYFGCRAAIAAADKSKQDSSLGSVVSALPEPVAKCLDTAFDIIKKRIAKELIDEMSQEQASHATINAD